MSLRLEMLQIARLAPRVLGDSAELVRAFLRRQWGRNGGALDRAGREDLYYTIFVLAGLQAMQSELPGNAVERYLRTFETGAQLDFVHLGALARCWAAIGVDRMPAGCASAILSRVEGFRCADGGYDDEPGQPHGNPYGCFVALGAYQDLHAEMPGPLRMVQCLKFLETPDGAWGNLRGLRVGNTPATAAAITLLSQLDMPVHDQAAAWLLEQQHAQGGFKAMPSAPLPDLLSTATALHALATMEVALPKAEVDRCLDFIDTLWNAEGGFHGHWADDELDAEYTLYGLLALGHLSLYTSPRDFHSIPASHHPLR